MADRFIPYARQCLDEEDITAVVTTLGSDWLTTGPKVAELESEVMGAVSAKHAVACANGTAALHLAALALNSGPHSATIVPSITFLATANAVRLAGGEVVFADVDPDTGLLTEESLQEAVARATRSGLRPHAVTPVHLTGRCCDMGPIEKIASECALNVVEDAAHAFGATYVHADGKTAPVGDCHHSDLSMFSFHAVKSITTGEGGVLTTNDDRLAARLRVLRNHGIQHDIDAMVNHDMAFDRDGDSNPWYYELHTIAPNYRMTDIQCALGIAQLSKLDRFMQARRDLADRYDMLIDPYRPHLKPLPRTNSGESAWHLYSVLIDFETSDLTKARLINELRQRGIGTQVHYIPVHRQPYYRERYGEFDLPGAEAYYSRTLSLPMFVGLTQEEQFYVVDSLVRVLGLEATTEDDAIGV